jgi:Winged helix-turn-helix DNA-binding
MELVARPDVKASEGSRDAGGRFATVRDRLVLFEIVQEVALVAARLDPDPYKEPTTVAQSAWNSARHSLRSRYGHIPQANEVCRQLPDRHGRPWPWRDLLELVFDEQRDAKKTWEERLSELDRPISHEHVYFALNFVRRQLGPDAALRFPHQYEEARTRLLEDAHELDSTQEALRQRLPTRGQIETACAGSWERALELAGLQSSGGEAEKGTPIPVIEAVLGFYEEHGYLPTRLELVETARREGVLLERTGDEPWFTFIERAQQLARERGLPEPPPYGTKPAGPDAENERGETVGTKGFYSRVQVLERVREFAATLPPATSATDKRWREFQRDRAGVPSLNVIRRHGGLRELLREASRPDWRRRAEAWDEQAVTAPRGGLGRPRSPKREEVEMLLRERGEASARELAEALGYTVDNVRRYLRQLKRAGRIEPTHEFARARNQRYRPAGVGESEAS